jgi:hypothetical protein
MRIDLSFQQLELCLDLFGFNLLQKKTFADAAFNDFEGSGDEDNKKDENRAAVIVKFLTKNVRGE